MLLPFGLSSGKHLELKTNKKEEFVMQTSFCRNADVAEAGSRPEEMSRRDFVCIATVAGGALLPGGNAAAQSRPSSSLPQGAATSGRGGLLYPQQNQLRNVLDASGIWQFQLDPKEEGEAKGWFKALPAPRQIAVLCSWNDLFDDARDYLGLAWYMNEVWVPSAWRGQRVFLRVGSANYAAKVWVNGTVVSQHLGGHLPFVAEITNQLAWDQKNVIAITVENKQLPERVPPGPGTGGGGVAGVMGGFLLTTYDFFPYAGLHRSVLLYSVPAEHIDDVTIVTTIDGSEGVVNVKVTTAGQYTGKGKARLNEIEADLNFRAGSAEATLRAPSARFWSPQDPHLYPLTLTLTDGRRATDYYALDIGIRTFAVRGDQLLLNGQPIKLTGLASTKTFRFTGAGRACRCGSRITNC